MYTAGDSKFTPSYVPLDGKVLQFYAYMKEDVPEIPAEVSSSHFRMRAKRITCHLVCVRPHAKRRRPTDYLPAHTYVHCNTPQGYRIRSFNICYFLVDDSIRIGELKQVFFSLFLS